MNEVHFVVVIPGDGKRMSLITIDDCFNLPILESDATADVIQELLFFRVHITISARKRQQAANVILLEGEILMLEKSNHVRRCSLVPVLPLSTPFSKSYRRWSLVTLT